MSEKKKEGENANGTPRGNKKELRGGQRSRDVVGEGVETEGQNGRSHRHATSR